MKLDPRAQTLASFDWQWARLPAGDFMPGDPWFDANATRVLANALARLLRRNGTWCSGEGLFALGGRVLLNPLGADDAVPLLRNLGATDIQRRPTARGTELIIARRND